jgi:alpha-tubulin suppressor-like RCC1 family protein
MSTLLQRGAVRFLLFCMLTGLVNCHRAPSTVDDHGVQLDGDIPDNSRGIPDRVSQERDNVGGKIDAEFGDTSETFALDVQRELHDSSDSDQLADQSVFDGGAVDCGSCDDGNPCTNDKCDPLVGCTHSYVFGTCGEGKSCQWGQCMERTRINHLIAAGREHSCAITQSGEVWCWGDNNYGQIGVPASAWVEAPIKVPGLPAEVLAVSCGGGHTCALLKNSEIWCWGDDSKGQLGSSAVSSLSDVPVKVDGEHNWMTVSVGRMHTCAISDDTGVWCWGMGDAGQLGVGYYADSGIGVPSAVALEDEAESLTVGTWHSCVVGASGGIWCWGEIWCAPDDDGVDSTFVDCGLSPTKVAGIENALLVGSGRRFACATTLDQIQCWGENDVGQCGNGTTSEKSISVPPSPVSLDGGSAVTLGLGSYHSCAVSENGLVWFWGLPHDQQAVGSPSVAEVPYLVDEIDEVTAVAGGYHHTCVMKASGEVFCWGKNEDGQLGDPALPDYVSTPVKVEGLP